MSFYMNPHRFVYELIVGRYASNLYYRHVAWYKDDWSVVGKYFLIFLFNFDKC